jgi:hypothetical protein
VDGVKINAYNIIIVGLMAMVFFVLAKMIFSKFRVPGVSDVVTMA